jgi:predicted RNA binding protein YcfA (HicA-like mRNA interferase family)
MKLPRDISGRELASLLSRYGYDITRQSGSHMRLSSSLKGQEHHITIPAHKPLKTGTLSGILKETASYLEMSQSELVDELFK